MLWDIQCRQDGVTNKMVTLTTCVLILSILSLGTWLDRDGPMYTHMDFENIQASFLVAMLRSHSHVCRISSFWRLNVHTRDIICLQTCKSSTVNNQTSSATSLQREQELYPNFSFTVLSSKDSASETSMHKARLGLLVTPSGSVQTPNFVFCATKAAAKALTMEQVKQAGTQLILSNTYHLMLSPGSDIVQSMGGLQKFTGWNGPMLTDSGGYQIFSMGHGSVSDEIKGRRLAKHGGSKGSGSGSGSGKEVSSSSSSSSSSLSATATAAAAAAGGGGGELLGIKKFPEKPLPLSSLPGQSQSLVAITEHGATFRSYVDGLLYELTPERSMHVQKGLGADLVVVLDECTPFNVSKEYTQRSMERSHRYV